MTGSRHVGGIEFSITNEAWRKLSVPIGTMVHITISYRNAVMFNQNVLYAESFGSVSIGEPVLYCGSSRYLSLDLNQDDFMTRYHIDTVIDWKAHLDF